MSQIITGIEQTKILTNLDTYNHTALLTSPYKVSVKLSMVPVSGITITIQQNSSTVATLPVADGQAHMELQAQLMCVASDVISVILASSTIQDKLINDFKAVLKITPGLV